MTTATADPARTTSAPLAATELSGSYQIDPTHSRIGFSARHAMVTKVRGAFNEFDGHAVLDFANPAASTATLTVEVASIDTRQAQRDAHLRTNDFFDAPTFPQITFHSTAISELTPERYVLRGDLTIKDVTRPVEIEFEYLGAARDPYGNVRVGFEGQTVINRSDYGITFNAALDTGGVLVSEKVTLEFEISAIRQDAAA